MIMGGHHGKGSDSPTEKDLDRISRDYVAGDIDDLDPIISRVSKGTADALEGKIRELQGIDENDPLGPPGPEGWGPDHPELPPRPTHRVKPFVSPRGEYPIEEGTFETIPPGAAMAPPRPTREYTPEERKFIESQKAPLKDKIDIDKILFEKQIKRETYETMRLNKTTGEKEKVTHERFRKATGRNAGKFMSKKSVDRQMRSNAKGGKSTIPGGP